ncbi:MAG: hypothetical protein AB1831_04895 [Pseudomonadota bacterium]
MKTIEATSALTQGIAPVTADYRRSAIRDAAAEVGGSDIPEAVRQTGKVSDAVGQPRQFGVLNAGKEAMNETAAEVRALGEARQLVARASEQLDRVVKSFPPFPPGSIEREQYLNSVVGIRNIIEKLTIPREPRAQLDEALGQQALVNGDATDEQLKAGQTGLINADLVLANMQAGVGRKLAADGDTRGDETFYAAESKRIGAELARQSSGISRSSEAMLALMG